MVSNRRDIQDFLHPTSVAIIGKLAGTRKGQEADAIVEGYRRRWGEKFFLVSPKGGRLGEVPIYRHVAEVPESIDLAVLNVGPANLHTVVEECHAAGVRNVVIFSSGFAETGAEGLAAENRLRELVVSYGMRALGPNTNTNAFDRPLQQNVPGGRVGLVTQSGNQGRPLVQADVQGFAYSRWVATGNEIDLDVADFIEYYAGDPDTSVIAAYVEGFRDGTKLRTALEAANRAEKPVVCIKIGRTDAGAAMASSHTGHLTGSDAVTDGLFRQYGVVRVDDIDELIETSALFAKIPGKGGPNCAIYGMSGGSTTMMAELAQLNGLNVPRLSDESVRELRTILPGYLATANPVDNGMQFLASAPSEQRQRVLEILADDPSTDVLITAVTDADSPFTTAFISDLAEFRRTHDTPVLCVWVSPRTNPVLTEELIDANIPIFRTYAGSMRAWRRHCDFLTARAGFRERQLTVPPMSELTAEILDREPGTLTTEETVDLLGAYGIPFVPGKMVHDRAEAAAAAEGFGYPVVMKIASVDIAHKSDADLVRVGVQGSEVEAIFEELSTRAASVAPDARIEGVLVQPQLSGLEIIVGLTRDPVLGSAVMIGMGGIYAELIRDTAVRPLPVDRADIEEMIRSLQAFPLLDGARGRKPVDLDSLIGLVQSVVTLAGASQGRIREFDLNPVLVSGDSVVAVDALVLRGVPEVGHP